MIFPVRADIIGLTKGVVESILPFARAHQVHLSFHSDVETLEALYQPEQITPALTQLLCRIITFTPQRHTVSVRVLPGTAQKDCLQIDIENSGANLSLLGEIRTGIHHTVIAKSQGRGSLFSLQIPLHVEKRSTTETTNSVPTTIIKPWYAEIRKRLTHHFGNPHNLERAAREKGEEASTFLKKANLIINSHLEQEGFNAGDLARSMALSRTQLFRRIKNLTQKAPGQYIRYIRLQKAKNLLEKEDLNVSEVAYRVGFASNSHFCRAFQRQFGLNPSSLK